MKIKVENTLQPKMNAILFSTVDRTGMSLPYIYFVPKTIALPSDICIHKFNHMSYTRHTGEKIGKWLRENCIYKVPCDAYICAGGRQYTSTPMLSNL